VRRHPGCPPTTAPPGDPSGRPYIAHRRRTGSRVYHARFRVASRRVRCTRGTPTLPGDSITGSDATWHVVGAVREPPLQRVRPRAAMFAGTTHTTVHTTCRGDAVRRPGTVERPGPLEPTAPVLRASHPPGDPAGRPYIACRRRTGSRVYHARARVASRRVRCTRGDAHAARRFHHRIRCNTACCRGRSRTAPTTCTPACCDVCW